MNGLYKNILSLSLISVATFAALSISLGNRIFNLNTSLLDIGGDGFKNYFTFAYQYKYGSGIHFKGLMYPYGDIAIFTDCQILFVWILQCFKSLGLDSERIILGILNSLPIIGIVLGAFLLLKIFKHYSIPFWFALTCSLCCVFLSPQIFRIQSHYALSYIYVIPSVWLFNIHIKKSKSLLLLLASMVFIFLHGFIHPYLLFICSVFSLSIFLSALIKRERPIPIWLLLQGTVAILAFMGLMSYLDPIGDRPENPYGLMLNKTEVSDLFPFFGWFKMLMGTSLDLRSGYTEGYAYPGVLFLLVPILFLIRYLVSRRLTNLTQIRIGGELWKYFISALICLCLGMGLHIILTNGLIVELIPKLKQFRTLGRISWVFYYVCFVFMAILFYRYTSKLKRGLKFSLWGVVALIMLTDVYAYHHRLNQSINKYSGNDRLLKRTSISDLLSEKQLSAQDFQGQFVLPSSTEGAEKLSFKDDWDSKQSAFSFAYQTGLPMTSIVMSRASISRCLKILQLSSSNYIEKDLVGELAKEKPLLVVIQNDKLPLFEDILSKSMFINKDEKISLYSYSIDALQQTKVFEKSILDSIPFRTDENINFFDFEDGQVEGLESKEAILIKGSHTICDIGVENEGDKKYSLSLWYRVLAEKSNVPHFNVQTFDKDGNQKQNLFFRDWDSRRVDVYDDWIRLMYSFDLNEADQRLRLIVHGEYLILDRVLIKPDHLEFKTQCNSDGVIQYNHSIGRIRS